MQIDYDKIRQENIIRYGTDIDEYGPILLENLYSDQTHFIYELLQNAEDAGATEVKFKLSNSCLELEHNGRPFNEDDVRGICGLVKGTKQDDLNQIGKFGIGFKSVYAHTQSPEVHCGDEHFVVRNYVLPYEAHYRISTLGTLFVFPFDNQNKPDGSSFAEISRRLNGLGIRTMLFLRKIESVEYEICGGAKGVYRRETELQQHHPDRVSAVRLLGESDLYHDDEEEWLVFKRDVQHEEHRIDVEIAFRIWDSGDEQAPQFMRVPRSNLYVSFPTERDTRLGFLVQGPFQTTSTRENVRENSRFNVMLANETGELVVETLRWLRDRNWLTTNLLQTLPSAYVERNRYYDYSEHRYRFRERIEKLYDGFLEPVYQKVKQALTNEALIPASGTGYVAAKDARIVGSVALLELLDSSQLQELFDFDEDSQWISDEITSDNAQNLWRHLTTILEVEEIDTEKFVRRIDHKFLRNQTDDWIRIFYEFLPTGYTIRELLYEKPIIRLEDGSHVKPFHKNEAQAYLPSHYGSGFPTVKKEVCNSTKSLSFLNDLGLKEPDVVDEVISHILPKYLKQDHVDQAEHMQDIELIIRALNDVPRDRKGELERDLECTPILLAINVFGDAAYRKPDVTYVRNSTLEMYFNNNNDVWFLAPQYAHMIEDLEPLGVFSGVVFWRRLPNAAGHVVISSPSRGSSYDPHKRGLYGFDPDFIFDGLEFALCNPNVERSLYIWNNLLIPHKNQISGYVESSPRQTFESSIIESQDSKMGKLVREIAWLPDGSGSFVTPSGLSLDNLPDDFHRDHDLAKALGMRPSIGTLHERDDIPDDVKQILQITQDRSPDELKRALALLDEEEEKQQDTPETLSPDQYHSELGNVFDHQSDLNSPKQPHHEDTSEEKTLEDRRIDAELDLSGEPDVFDRYQLSISRRWEAKNPETRKFLLNEYGGECQICGETFNKRDGKPYFEAVHFIRRTKARWLDHPRNALCLCANHSAQIMYGELATPDHDILNEIRSSEEGRAYNLTIILCGESQTITFTANHMDEFRSGIDVADQF